MSLVVAGWANQAVLAVVAITRLRHYAAQQRLPSWFTANPQSAVEKMPAVA
jgi:hypothetical protein